MSAAPESASTVTIANISRQLRQIRVATATIAAVVFSVTLTSCGDTKSLSYVMTVKIMTPAGLVTSSSARLISSAPNYSGEMETSVKGESVVIDMGNGKVAFALLQAPGDTNAAIAYAEALSQFLNRDKYYNRLYVSQPEFWSEAKKVGQRVLTLKCWRSEIGWGATPGPKGGQYSACPTFVTFKDRLRPSTLVIVPQRAFSEAFGKGYELVSVSVQQADYRPKATVVRYLPWLNTAEPKRQICGDAPPSPCESLQMASFINN